MPNGKGSIYLELIVPAIRRSKKFEMSKFRVVDGY